MPQPRIYRSAAERQAAYRRRGHAAQAALQAAKGLPPLPRIAAMPATRRWRVVLEQVESALTEVQDQMRSYYDDRSDEWQDSEKAQAFEERMDAVATLLDQVAECRSTLE